MALYFTSDTHFGDHRTLNIHKRPFHSTRDMDEELVRRWNAAVSADDEIWHLGDFARTVARAAEILPLLSGTKHLVRGNNDPEGIDELAGWASAQDYAELDDDGRLLVLSHYPFRSWNGQHRKSVDLHGHSHGKLKPLPRQVDVGVDAWDFAPVSLERVIEAADSRRARG